MWPDFYIYSRQAGLGKGDKMKEKVPPAGETFVARQGFEP
jgi:hypothetical protein